MCMPGEHEMPSILEDLLVLLISSTLGSQSDASLII